MKTVKKETIRRCLCPCKKELPSRYKGQKKIYFSPECRKVHKGIPLTKKENERYTNMLESVPTL